MTTVRNFGVLKEYIIAMSPNTTAMTAKDLVKRVMTGEALYVRRRQRDRRATTCMRKRLPL